MVIRSPSCSEFSDTNSSGDAARVATGEAPAAAAAGPPDPSAQPMADVAASAPTPTISENHRFFPPDEAGRAGSGPDPRGPRRTAATAGAAETVRSMARSV